jgi:hypothetical protein
VVRWAGTTRAAGGPADAAPPSDEDFIATADEYVDSLNPTA